MGGFFSIEGPFYKFGSILADIMYLSVLWGFFTIIGLGFTAGASTTALYYVVTRRLSDHEGYIFRDFWKSFRQNFKQSTIVWLIILAIGFILTTNMFNMKNINVPNGLKLFLQPLQMMFFVELVALSVYIFPLISRFTLSIKSAFITSVFMVHKHLFTSLLLLAMMVVVILACFQFTWFIFFAIGTYAFGASYFFMKIFKKYRPDIDPEINVSEEEN